MNKYTIKKPEWAPEWFTPGIKCRVRNDMYDKWSYAIITWFRSKCPRPYIDHIGVEWKYAEPVERWRPEPEEYIFLIIKTCSDSFTPILDRFSRSPGYNDECDIYRITDQTIEFLKNSKLNAGWLRKNGERYEP